MRTSEKTNPNGVKIRSLVMFALLLIIPGMALGDEPLHVFFTGVSAPSMGGRTLAAVGDFNQDGHEDYLVGVPEDPANTPYKGAVYLVSGADGSELALFEGETNGERFGDSVACAGDLNLDGVKDLLIASRYAYGNSAGVFVYSGADGTRLYALPEPSATTGFGEAMVSLGDTNGDGISDIAIAAPYAFSDDRGAVYLYSGAQEGELLHTWTGNSGNSYFGQKLVAEDIDDNGIIDLIIAAPSESDGSSTECGAVYWVTDGMGPAEKLFQGDNLGQRLGVAIAAVKNANGDGPKEIAALDATGEIHLFSGVSDSFPPGTHMRSFSLGLTPSEHADLIKLVPSGDFNGDGAGDLLVGRPTADDFTGKAEIVSSTDGSVLKTYTGFQSYSEFGARVAADVDLDGDGSPDLLIGAGAVDPPDGGSISGAVYAFRGAGGLSPHDDADGDGMLDSWELNHGLDPSDPTDAELDFDGDSLTNLSEYTSGTHPMQADTDDDGLFDGDEIGRGLDPLRADSDEDGVPDGWEDRYGLDPLDGSDGDGDRDGDGLTNQAEFQAGTDPTKVDTDGDTLSDGDEVHTHQTDPTQSDSDNDGLSDGAEITLHLTDPHSADSDGDRLLDGAEVNIHHTNPLDTDSDDDGLPDEWEVDKTFDPNDATDAALDADGDAATNLAEFQAATDPHNPSHYPGGPGSLRWSFSAPSQVSPASLDLDGTIYITSSDNTLYALNPNGTQKWSYQLAKASGKTAVVAADGTIYLNEKSGTSPQTLYSIDPDGILNWSNTLPGFSYKGRPAALAEDGTIYVPVGGQLMAFAPDGTEKWTAVTDGSDTSSPAVAEDGTIYVKSHGDRLYAFDPNGGRKWVVAMTGRTRLADAGPVIADDGTIYVCDNGGATASSSVRAFNPDGTVKWSYSIGRGYGPVSIAQDGTLYVAAGQFYALSADGNLKWDLEVPGGLGAAPAIGKDGTIYVSRSSYPNHSVYALNPDGSIFWRFETAVIESLTAPVLGPTGTLYVGSWEGNFYAFNTVGVGPADSAWPMMGHDAQHTGNATSMINHPPVLSIESPVDGSVFNVDDGPIVLEATAFDPEEGDLSGSVTWLSSLDETIDTSATLSVGTHTLTARVADSYGATASASISVTIEAHLNVTPPDAGPDQLVAGDSATLDANVPLVGTGVWTVLAGEGSVADPSDPKSTVTGLSVGINALVWSISYQGGSAEQDMVIITREGEVVGRSAVFAGTGESGSSGDGGPALEARFSVPQGIAVDRFGNVYIADDNKIRKIDGLSGVITTYAGAASGGFSGDGGSAVDALLNVPQGLVTDRDGNLFIADRNNNRIRRIDGQTGIITTVAGNGFSGIGGIEGDGGAAIEAAINNPEDVAVDAQGNLYIADTRNDRIRKVDGSTGIITTVAGSGTYGGDSGYTGDGGLATEAKLSSPEAVAVDSVGNVFIADTGNGVVRKVGAETGIITTVISLYNVIGITVDLADNVYAVKNCAILKLDTLGELTTIQSQCLGQNDIAADVDGDLYITRNAYRVEKIDLVPAIYPVISIQSPVDGFRVNRGDGPLTLNASASDAEDGDLTSQVVWTSSIDGVIQPGAVLSIGTHTLTARVTDSDGLATQASVIGVITSAADQYTIKGGVHATYLDDNHDGEFTQADYGSNVTVAERRISYLNSYFSNRANLEMELSALRESGQHVSRAAMRIYVVGAGGSNAPFQMELYGYQADGVAELADADSGDQIIGWLQVDGTGLFEADITGYINQLIDSGTKWGGLSLRMAEKADPTDIDEHITFIGFDYASQVLTGAALLVSYAEPPVVTITSPVGNVVYSEDDGAIAFAASAIDPEDGEISANIGWHSNLDGDFTPPAALSVGTHTVTASVTDSSGLTGSAAILVTIEPHVNLPPVVSINIPADGSTFNEDDGAIAFNASAVDPEDGEISADISWHSDLDGDFTPPVALSVGTHTVTASVTDNSGLTAWSTITVVVGAHVNQAPEVILVSPRDGESVYRNNWPIMFTANAIDPEQGDLSTSIEWTSSLDGAFTSPATLSAGWHMITASATDSQGLTGSAEMMVLILEADNLVHNYERFIETGIVRNVGNQNWTTVHLAGFYEAMVVVCTPVYDNGAAPMVTRIQNAVGSSFELKLDRADGQTGAVTGIDVYYIAAQAGVYTESQHGITMEAVRIVSSITDGKGSWKGEPQTYANDYTSPVVIGQVMTCNDPAFSVFWSSGTSKRNPASASAIKVGKHAGEDPNLFRADETLGYFVVETASGAIGNLAYTAGVGADIVTGMPRGTKPGIRYGVAGITEPTGAVLSQSAMDGNNGGWPVLYGPDPILPDTIELVIDEDKLSDAERNHTTEQVSYLVFGQ